MLQSKSIVFIHGLFVNNTTWSEWQKFFEARGFTTYAPANPKHEGNPADLRKNHPEGLNQVSLEDVVMNISRFIDTLPEKPIIVGHSLAGFVVQKLIEMDKAVAGISIDGAPPKNVLPPFQTVKTVFPVVNFFKSGPFMGSRTWYKNAFFNNLTEEEANAAYDKIAVPESRTIARNTLFKSFANIDHSRSHNPLLFIGGENDNIFPASFTKRIAGAYKDKNSITDFKSFPGRSHFTCGEPGWETVAQYVNDWISGLKS